jgi:Flp pilus assembly protein TadD
MLSAVPASAQTSTTTGAFTERPDDALSRNLRGLAADPKSVTALMGAGKAALELGDPQAALTFFARAEEQLPRDGRIKMWIGSALIRLQQPHAALKFFRDATELGVPEAEVASDRGLAHDIAGNPRDAQRDYRLALQHGRDDEVTRRLALSLAISGEREPALRLLEDQLLVRDRAAERARALVLALTGDAAGAARAVQASMPGPQAGAMAPFLARLPSLAPAERALAVHLGIFPGDGRTAAPTTYAANDFASAVTDAGRPDPSQPSLARRPVAPEPVSTAPRRRPGAGEAAVGAGTNFASVAPAPVTSSRSPRTPPPRSESPTTSRQPARSWSNNPAWAWSRGLVPAVQRPHPAETKPKPVEVAPRQAEAEPEAAPPPGGNVSTSEAAVPAQSALTSIIDTSPAPLQPQTQSAETNSALGDPPAQARPAETAVALADPPVPAPESEPVPTGSRLADLNAAIASIPEAAAAPVKPKPHAAATPASGKPQRATAAAPPKKAKPSPPAEPSRVWVQVAGGADKGALPHEYARLKAKAPKLLGARAAWTAPLNATNRLLVGPFAGAKEAQAFVNQLKAQDLSGFAWTSAAGQKIEKLPAK